MNGRRENSIAVIPYIVYDALMERFERTQAILRAVATVAAIIAVGLVFLVVKGSVNGNRNDTQHY